MGNLWEKDMYNSQGLRWQVQAVSRTKKELDIGDEVYKGVHVVTYFTCVLVYCIS